MWSLLYVWYFLLFYFEQSTIFNPSLYTNNHYSKTKENVLSVDISRIDFFKFLTVNWEMYNSSVIDLRKIFKVHYDQTKQILVGLWNASFEPNKKSSDRYETLTS